MMFLVVGRRKPGFVHARRLLMANLSAIKRLEKKKFFVFVADFANGNGGVAIANCRSNDELYRGLMSLPLAGQTDYEISPLVALDTTLDRLRMGRNATRNLRQ